MDNTGENRYGLLTGTGLKLIAMASMVLDHLGDNFFPGAVWMRALGRIAMPVFAFCVAEGFIHTHDRMRYFRRLGLFGVVSEVPFDLVTAGKLLEFGHQNIMASFFWAILALPLMIIPMGRRFKVPQWVWYAAYPVHLLVIGVIRNWDSIQQFFTQFQ